MVPVKNGLEAREQYSEQRRQYQLYLQPRSKDACLAVSSSTVSLELKTNWLLVKRYKFRKGSYFVRTEKLACEQALPGRTYEKHKVAVRIVS